MYIAKLHFECYGYTELTLLIVNVSNISVVTLITISIQVCCWVLNFVLESICSDSLLGCMCYISLISICLKSLCTARWLTENRNWDGP